MRVTAWLKESSFFVGLIGGSFFLTSFVFGYFSSNASGSSFLTLPASTFEKWFCGILIATILYPLIFILFFRVIDASFVLLYHNSLDPASPFYKQEYESVYLFDLDGFIAMNVYALFFIYVGAMLIGSLYFNKTAVIKVALSLCILFVLIVGLNWLLAMSLFGNIDDAAPFNHVAIRIGNEIGSLEMPSAAGRIFKYTVIYFFPAAMWLLSFTRLREKEF